MQKGLMSWFALAVALSVTVAFGEIRFFMPVGTPEGGGKIRQLLTSDDPSKIPGPIIMEKIKGGRMEVVNGAPTFIRFYRDGVDVPVREYVMTPGETVFSLVYNFNGGRKSETKWIFKPDGSCEMERYDAAGNLLVRENNERFEDEKTVTSRHMKGDVVTESIYEKNPDYGKRKVFEARGTGPNRVWKRMAYYHDGIAAGRIHSQIDSDGYWAIYEYCRIEDHRGNVRLGESAVTVPMDGAKGITNAEGVVVSFVGKARRTECRYDSLFPEDNDDPRYDKPRETVVYEVSQDGARKEISREYHVRCIDEGKHERMDIHEEAAPGAPFGAPGNRRTVECRYWENWRTRLKYTVSPEGVMHVVNTIDLGDVAKDDASPATIFEEYDTATNAPYGTPFRTVIGRRIVDRRDRTLREEKWILLLEGDRELLSWKNYRRDDAGRVIGTETSGGEHTERVWEDGDLVSERGADGLERHWRYDAIGRLVQSDANVYEHNFRYDLGSLVTNAFGSIFGRKYDYGLSHDDAGRLTGVAGEPGGNVKTENGADGVTRTWLNGRLVRSEVTEEGKTIVYEGPRGLDSPRWHQYSFNYEGRYSVSTVPGIHGGVVSVTNRFDRDGRDGDSRVETETSYRKIDGCWWREDTVVRIRGTEREVLGGRRERVTGWRKDGGIESVTLDAKGNETQRLRIVDAQSKMSMEAVRRPTSSRPETTVCSNGVVVMTVSASGVTNIFERGFQGQLLSQADGRGGVTRYAYDGKGRCVERIDRRGGRWTYGYDWDGRRIAMTIPSGETVRTEYDAFGRIASEGCGGTKVTYGYDEYGDLASMAVTEDGKTVRELRCYHDEATGLLTNRVANGRAVAFSYSVDNTLRSVGGIEIEAAMVARTNGLEIARDELGRAIGYSVNGVPKLSQSYDPETGRVDAFAVEGLGEVHVSYLPGTDLVETLAYPGGVTARFEYDAEDTPLRVAWLGLPSGPCTFEAPERKAWAAPDLDGDESSWDAPPIATDPQVYVLRGQALANPVAALGEDGVMRWCLLDQAFGRVGLVDGEEAER